MDAKAIYIMDEYLLQIAEFAGSLPPELTNMQARVNYLLSQAIAAQIAKGDGIVEARNTGNRLFGMRRAMRVIRQHSGGDARALVGAIDRAVTEFRGDAPQVDDITCVVAKCL